MNNLEQSIAADLKKIEAHWNAMNNRCRYHENYICKGIKVCQEWDGPNGLQHFIDWSLNNGYQDNLTLDRKCPNLDYEPVNCQWILKGENSRKTHRQDGPLNRLAISPQMLDKENYKMYSATNVMENARKKGLKIDPLLLIYFDKEIHFFAKMGWITVKKVRALKDMILLIDFSNGVKKKFNVNERHDIFKELNEDLFYQVKIDFRGYGVAWPNSIYLPCDELWENGTEFLKKPLHHNDLFKLVDRDISYSIY